MNVTPEDIERIVSETLRRLGGADSAPHATVRETPVLRVFGSVVSLAEVEGRVERISEIVAPARAVITPAARDYLKAKGVAVTQLASETNATGAKTRLAIAVDDPRFDRAALSAALRRDGVDVQHLASSGLAQSVVELADTVVKDGVWGLLITDDTPAALCLANRRRGVRSGLANDAAEALRAVASIGANLLVVAPRGKAAYAVTRIVKAFCDAGERVCPPSYRDWL